MYKHKRIPDVSAHSIYFLRKRIALWALLLVASCLCFQARGQVAQAAPFTCSGSAIFYQTQTTIGTQLYALNTATASYTLLGGSAEALNAIGYNTTDDYIYGYLTTSADPNRNNFVRLHNDGTVELLGIPTGLTYDTAPSGDFDQSGSHYQIVGTTGDYQLARTVLSPSLSVSYTPVTGSVISIQDLVYSDGKLYGLSPTQLMEVDIDTATTTVKDLTSALPVGAYGAAWVAVGGEMYFSHNNSGTIYQVFDYDTSDPYAVPVLSTGNNAFGNDGASCSLAQTTIELITASDDNNATVSGVPVTGNVLPNDMGQDITVTGYTQPSNGTVVVNPDGSYTYTPNAGFTGVDSFSYTITDANGNTTTATVRITVTAAAEAADEELAETGRSHLWAGLASIGSVATLLGIRRRRAYALIRK